MHDSKLSRFILVYFLMIPLIWFLSEAVWGGIHGAIGGIKIEEAHQSYKTTPEMEAFLKQNGFYEDAGKNSEAWLANLSKDKQDEYYRIYQKSLNVSAIVSFGSAFAVCAIIFGLVGFLSGVLTKIWLYVGIIPLVSFFINNPIWRIVTYGHITISQRAIIIISQFVVCYIFAYAGATLANKMAEKKQYKTEKKP